MVRRSFDERNVLAKLIKMYVMFNPFCTARDISVFLSDNQFGIVEVTPLTVSKIITDFNAKGYHWFDLLKVREQPCRYVVREYVEHD